jgi:hypothetical protein
MGETPPKGNQMAVYQVIIEVDDPDVDIHGVSVVFEEAGTILNIVELLENN